MPDNYLSFDIGARNLHLVEGFVKGNAVWVLNGINVELPKGTITDGVIINKEALSLAMQEAASRIGTSSIGAIITINTNNVLIREFEVPAGNPKELEGMIKSEVAQYFSISDSDIVEYRKIAEFEDQGIRKVKVRAGVMNREVAADYYNLLLGLKLKPLALDIHPNVISKLFTAETILNGQSLGLKNIILLDIGYSGTMIYLLAQGSLELFRFTTFGFKAIDSLLSNVLIVNEEEAEKIRIDSLAENKDLEDNKAYTTVRPLYGELLEELRKVIQFFQSRSGSKKMDDIVLMGGGASLAGLIPVISQGLGVETGKLSEINTVTLNDSRINLGTAVYAAGALIRLGEQVRR